MEDKEIVDLYWERNELAIEETAKKYGNYCRKIAFSILRNEEDTLECINDTYLKVWESIPEERPHYFIAYIAKIAKNISINRYNKKMSKKRGSGEITLVYEELANGISSKSEIDSLVELQHITEVINVFLGQLDTIERIIFVRRYWYVDSIKDIAKRYHYSEGLVKTKLHRLRKQLKKQLLKEGVEV